MDDNSNNQLLLDKDISPLIIESNKKSKETLRKLWIVCFICMVFMIIEVIGGYLAHSIAIMSDAAHLLSDLLGFLISIVSIYISQRKATKQMSYGYHRAEIIGALVSVCIIWGLTIWLLYEASLRIIKPEPVNGLIMLITAILGFLFNIIMGLTLLYEGIEHTHFHSHDHEGHDHSHGHSHGHTDTHGHIHGQTKKNDKKKVTFKDEYSKIRANGDLENHNHDHDHDHDHDHEHEHDHETRISDKTSLAKSDSHNHNHEDKHGHGHKHEMNVNLRAALIHIVGDAVQNLGVIIAGIIIYFWPHLSIADPICTFVFSIIVIFTTIRILKDCIGVLMEGSPLAIDIDQLTNDLLEVQGVEEVHDLHVWSLSVGKVALSAHLLSSNPQVSLAASSKLCKDKYKITHSTIQVEHFEEKHLHDCDHDLH